MAGTVVHVIVSGIVSIVPQADNTYVLRMQDARQAVHKHVVSLVTERQYTRKSPPFERRLPANDAAIYYGWLLENGTITIEDAPTGGVDASGMTNVLRIGDSCKDGRCGVMDVTKFKGVELKVAGGVLTTAALEPYRWRFGNEPEHAARRVAEEICWTFEVPGDTLKFRVPGRNEEFEISAPEGDDIEIRLQNAPERDAIPIAEEHPPERIDEHMQLYFELSSAPPNPKVDLLREEGVKPLPVHLSHRLSGRRIVKSVVPPPSRAMPTDAAQARAMALLAGRWRVVRVNCPPGLWDGP